MTETEKYDIPGETYLIKKPNGQYRFHTEHGSWTNSLRKVWQKMHFEFGIKNSDVRLALQEMGLHGHPVASFGIYGGFILTLEKFTVK